MNFFPYFLTDSNSASNFACYEIIAKQFFFLFYLHFLITLKPNADESVEKNEKRVSQMCLRIPFYINFLSGKKNSKLMFPTVQ